MLYVHSRRHDVPLRESVSCRRMHRLLRAGALCFTPTELALSLLLLEQDQPPTLFLSVHLAQLLGADGRPYFAQSRGLVLRHLRFRPRPRRGTARCGLGGRLRLRQRHERSV